MFKLEFSVSTVNGVQCQAISNNIQVIVNSINPGSISGNQTICNGGTASSISVIPSGGVSSNYLYQWYSNSVAVNYGGNAITGATNINYTPSLGGSNYYYAVVTNAAAVHYHPDHGTNFS